MRRRTRRSKQRGGGLVIQYPAAQVRGQKISLGAVQGTPAVALNVRPTPLHTLIMHDPDAPGHDAAHPWLHWLVVNIPGSDFSAGQQLLGYFPPKPPSGIHRYRFTLYEQRFGTIRASVLRPENFDLAAFVRDNSLIKVGEVSMRVSRI